MVSIKVEYTVSESKRFFDGHENNYDTCVCLKMSKQIKWEKGTADNVFILL